MRNEFSGGRGEGLGRVGGGDEWANGARGAGETR